jgi:hypothetical protein
MADPTTMGWDKPVLAAAQSARRSFGNAHNMGKLHVGGKRRNVCNYRSVP